MWVGAEIDAQVQKPMSATTLKNIDAEDGQVRMTIKGEDVFKPQTGEVVSGEVKSADIACRFIDRDDNEESFVVRHAYFLGANDP